MKFAEPRPYADPEKAARRIVEIANTVEPAQERAVRRPPMDGRCHDRRWHVRLANRAG
jgi:hypothetical protein